MTEITTEFVGTEVSSVRLARLGAIHDFWFGEGAFEAAGTLAGVAAEMNTLLTDPITEGELFVSWMEKWNALNNPSKMVHDTLFGDVGLAVDNDAFGVDGITSVALQGGIALAVDDFEGLELGAEILVNGPFAADTDWTKGTGWTISGGQAVFSGTGPVNFNQTVAPVILDKVYLVEINVASVTGTLTIRLGNSSVIDLSITAPGVYRFLTVSDGTAFFIQAATGTTAAAVNSVSVKEILNFPAFQNTVAARGLAGRAPSDVRNLLANSGLAGAVAGTPGGTAPTSWANGNTGGNISAVAPDGDQGGNSIRVSAAIGRRNFDQSITSLPNTTYTFSARVEVYTGAAINRLISWITIPSGAVVTYEIDGVAAAASDVPAVGVRTLTAKMTTAATGGTATARWGVGVGGDVTADVRFWAPQLEIGSSRSGYQRTGSGLAPDITEDNVLSHPIWAGDGTDDAANVRVRSGQAYGIFLPGRYGSLWYGGFTAAADGTITVGPTSVFFNGVAHAGIPTGILRACGTVPWSSRLLMAGYNPFVLTKAVMTTEELRLLVRRYAAIGAKGLLVAGPNLWDATGVTIDTGWTDNGGGSYTRAGGTAAVNNVRDTIGLLNGSPYETTFTISGRTAGQFRISLGGAADGALINTNGTFTEHIIARTNALAYLTGADTSWDGTVSAVSIRLLTPEAL